MPKFYVTVLRYDTEAKQADTTQARRLVVAEALREADAYVASKLPEADKKRQIWGLFAAPEYLFANVLLHGNHRVGDVRHLAEGDKIGIEGWLKELSNKHPRHLLFPGSIAWKKPLDRGFLRSILKRQTRTEKAAAALRGHTRDFADGDLERKLSADKMSHTWRSIEDPSDNRWFESKVPTGIIANGVHYTNKLEEVRFFPTVVQVATSNQDKLAELGGGKVTHMARNTCLVYLAGKRLAKYNKVQDFHEVLDKGGTVYVPGTKALVFEAHGVKYGVEICMDHLAGPGAGRLPPEAVPDVQVVLSAKVQVQQTMLWNPSAMVVHACSLDEWSLVGRGGTAMKDVLLEKEEPDFRIYSFKQ